MPCPAVLVSTNAIAVPIVVTDQTPQFAYIKISKISGVSAEVCATFHSEG
jgi:hypothetical protein